MRLIFGVELLVILAVMVVSLQAPAVLLWVLMLMFNLHPGG